MRIKIFSSTESTDDLENKVAEWTNDLYPVILNARLSSNTLYNYSGGVSGGAYRSYSEYIIVITYELRSEKKIKLTKDPNHETKI